MNKLIESAKIWNELSDFKLHIVYGYKAEKISIYVDFKNEDYFHLAGFQYLNDITLPKFSKSKTINKVLDETINFDVIQNSINYLNKVEPRLDALCSVKSIFRGHFKLYRYNKNLYSFYSNIKADYLVFDEVTRTPYFLFLREGEECFKTISTFSKGSRNYTENQKVLNILLIEFINTKLNSSSVIYKNPNYI